MWIMLWSQKKIFMVLDVHSSLLFDSKNKIKIIRILLKQQQKVNLFLDNATIIRWCLL